MRYILLLLVLVSIPVMAQDLPTNSLDDIYTPLKGSVLDGSGKAKSSSSGSSSRTASTNTAKNMIGFNPSLLFRGIACFSYDRVLNDHFVVGAAIGFSFRGDLIALLTQKIRESSDYSPYSHPAVFQHQFSYTTSGINPFLQLQGKFFLDADPYEGNYLALNYRLFSNNMIYGGEFNQTFDGISPQYKMTVNSISFLYGSQWESSSGNVIHDLYIGLGYKTNSFPIYPIKKAKNSSSEPDSIDDVESFSTSSSGRGSFSNFMFLFGYSFSFSF